MFCTHWAFVFEANLRHFGYLPTVSDLDLECYFLVLTISTCHIHVYFNFTLEHVAGKNLDWRQFKDSALTLMKCIDLKRFSIDKFLKLMVNVFEARQSGDDATERRLLKTMLFAVVNSV